MGRWSKELLIKSVEEQFEPWCGNPDEIADDIAKGNIPDKITDIQLEAIIERLTPKSIGMVAKDLKKSPTATKYLIERAVRNFSRSN